MLLTIKLMEKLDRFISKFIYDGFHVFFQVTLTVSCL